MYKKINGEKEYKNLVENFESSNLISDLDEKEKKISEDILKIFESIKKENNEEGHAFSNKGKYKFDCNLAIKLYEYLNYSEREASDDNTWAYIQIKMVPEILIFRWGIENTAKERYFKNKKDMRIYFKSLWWYAHIACKNDVNEGLKIILSNNFTEDTIVNLVERKGKKGYDLELYYQILKQSAIEKITPKEFRQILVLNSARVGFLSPALSNGGTEKYVERLIKDIRK